MWRGCSSSHPAPWNSNYQSSEKLFQLHNYHFCIEEKTRAGQWHDEKNNNNNNNFLISDSSSTTITITTTTTKTRINNKKRLIGNAAKNQAARFSFFTIRLIDCNSKFKKSKSFPREGAGFYMRHKFFSSSITERASFIYFFNPLCWSRNTSKGSFNS